jgi:riboflavin biosynthesis pyrimidine reductase
VLSRGGPPHGGAALSPGAAPLLERLDAGGPPQTARALLATIDARGRARAQAPYVLLNMITTLDGRAALDGSTRALGGPADLEMLLELRVLADAVLVGSGTLRAEGYGRMVGSPERRAWRTAQGLAADPPAVLISRELDLPWEAGLFRAPEQPVLIYTRARQTRLPQTEARVEVVGLDALEPQAVLGDLRRRGIAVLLCEGGPTLNAWLLAARAVDELFLTLTALLSGNPGEPTILGGPALVPPVKTTLEWVLRHGNDLFLRYGFEERESAPKSLF